MIIPIDTDIWLWSGSDPLPVGDLVSWASRPDCGAVVSFTGLVRNHSEGVEGVTSIEYEAYQEYVLPRLQRIVDEIRAIWPGIRRIALLHRIGQLQVGEASVAVVVSSPHRVEAFEAARFAIEEIKTAVPIWKTENRVTA